MASLYLSDEPEVLKQKFMNLTTRQDVAKLLDVDYDSLIYYLYYSGPSKKYTTFQIAKKNGGMREISAPTKGLKIVQQKLNQVLNCIYTPKAAVHGFVSSITSGNTKNIVTNADAHKGQRFVLNLDLEDFFPTIHFGRVRGIFMKPPFDRNALVATTLAQICCFNNQLPQGSPCSPTVSNLVCAKLDGQLRALAKKHQCIYTRYADDITFSTSKKNFPPALAEIDMTGRAVLGDELKALIISNGFKVNEKKTRLQTRYGRQEVTGLTTNKFPNVQRGYVRQIRAMLYAWGKFGYAAAEAEYHSKYYKKSLGPYKTPPAFKYIVKGKIEFLGMVRGKNNRIYRHFLTQLAALDSSLVRKGFLTPDKSAQPLSLIFTEGKTDWKHLKSALAKLQAQGRFRDLNIAFSEDETDIGDEELLKRCEARSKEPNTRRSIYIFDRDNPRILSRVSGEDGSFKNWTNDVYSFPIPIPSHRESNPDISLEFYYRDSEMFLSDGNGRRLFSSSEFHEKSGRHLSENLNCIERNSIGKPRVSIIDKNVYDQTNQNVALPKIDFATYIHDGVAPFDNFDVSEFGRIFEVIEIIQSLTKK